MTGMQTTPAGRPIAAKKRPGRLRILFRKRPELLIAPLGLVAIIWFWEWSVVALKVPTFILPPPSKIWEALLKGLSYGPNERAGYWLHARITLEQIVLGFIAGCGAGLVLGTIISQFRLLEATLRIYLVAIQSLPKIALAPIIVLWFGFGLTSKVVIIALLTFFPLLVTSLAGFRAVDRERLELMRALGAGPWTVFWKVRVPSALPYIFAGLEMASVFSIVGAVVGEFVGAQFGLGTLILSMTAQMDMAGTFSVFIILSLIGIGMHGLLKVVQKRVLFWTETESSEQPPG